MVHGSALSSETPRTGATSGGAGPWLACTAVAAVFVSAADAVLLQAKRSIFAGGFLAAEQLDTTGERIAFALVSLLSDAALASLLVFLLLALARRLRLRPAAARVLAVTGAAAPFLLSAVLAYELYRYLGDAMNLGLLFDLTGRSTREVLAVSLKQLGGLATLLALTVGGVAIMTAVAQRFSAGAPMNRRVRAWLPLFLLLFGGAAHVEARLENPTLDDALRRKTSGDVFGWLTQSLTDFDRDGYGMLSRPADPAPFNAQVAPYAVDWPGNGIDENGIGGDLRAGTSYVEGRIAAPWQQHPTVVLVVLESFRADAVGATVNGRAVTPNLDRLAAAGISSSRAYSHNGYTAQSRFHLLAGSLAGLRGGTSLIDDFKANGYETGYFSGQDDSFGGPEFAAGMERADVAFDARSAPHLRYSTFSTAGSLAVPAEVVEQEIAKFLDRRRRDKPLFLYVNLHDTHFPYHHDSMQPLVSKVHLPQSDITPDRGAELREMYSNAAANVDASIGRILERVEAHVGGPAGIIVVGDHGESLFDEGFLGHGYALNDAQTRIPLVVANLPLVVEEPFGQADLRDMIGSALERPAASSTKPVVADRQGKMVFQYLGLLDKPRTISAAGTEVTVELRSRTQPADPFAVALVERWESMILARSVARGGAPR